MPKITSYKRKSRKMEFSNHKRKNSNEESVKHNRKKQDSSKTNDDNKNKNKYRQYKEIYGEFKKIKPPMFNGEIEKGEEVEAWLFGMKKYFQIYNYSDELKAKMAIYNLTGKVDI